MNKAGITNGLTPDGIKAGLILAKVLAPACQP
jgi:hypothetical protein